MCSHHRIISSKRCNPAESWDKNIGSSWNIFPVYGGIKNHEHRVCMCMHGGYVRETRWGVCRMISWMHELQYGKLNLNANAAAFLDSQ